MRFITKTWNCDINLAQLSSCCHDIDINMADSMKIDCVMEWTGLQCLLVLTRRCAIYLKHLIRQGKYNCTHIRTIALQLYDFNRILLNFWYVYFNSMFVLFLNHKILVGEFPSIIITQHVQILTHLPLDKMAVISQTIYIQMQFCQRNILYFD